LADQQAAKKEVAQSRVHKLKLPRTICQLRSYTTCLSEFQEQYILKTHKESRQTYPLAQDSLQTQSR